MTITYVGAGAITHANYNAVANPPLPTGVAAGDLLLCCAYMRSNGTLTSTWATHVSNDGSSTYLLISYRIATGSDAGPTLTPVSGLGGQHHTSVVLAFRGVDPVTPLGTPGTAAQYSAAEDIGPVAAASATAADGAVVVVGCRNDANLEDPTIGVLSGDGLTWVEAAEGASADNASHLVVDYAIWTGAAPTLTPKTFDVSTSTASTSAGVMLLLKPIVAPAVSFVSMGQRDVFGDNETTPIGLPSGIQDNDLLFLVSYLMNAGTLSVSAGWIEHSLVDTTVNGSSFYLRTWYKFVSGAQTEPEITISGGSTAPQSLGQAFVYAFRGINQSAPFATAGANSFNASAVNIGPIAAPASAPQSGVALVVGHRNGPEFEVAGTLTGDGLTWVKDFDNFAFTLNGQGFSSAGYHAVWSTSAPSLTAKTIVPGVSTTGPGLGKMWVLQGADFGGVQERQTLLSADTAVAVQPTLTTAADVSVIEITGNLWTGVYAAGDHDDILEPALPPNIVDGDLLIAVAYLRGAGTLALSGGGGNWVQNTLVDANQNGSLFYLRAWHRLVDGTESAPTITPSGGSTSPQSLATSFVLAARGVNQASPFAASGADSFNATAANVGPIAVPTSLPASGMAIVIGVRNGIPWTSVATLSGDGLDWIEVSDAYTNTQAGAGTAVVVDYASWQGGAPILTAKTFAVTGGSASPGMGKMLVLNTAYATGVASLAADVVLTLPNTIIASSDVYVLAAVTNTRSCAADVYAVPAGQVNTKAVAADVAIIAQSIPAVVRNVFADVLVARAVSQQTLITFGDVVVIPAITSPEAALSAVAELSAESTDTAWLVLLTLDHPAMGGASIRVTSDAVPTTSRGQIYSPFPFEAILPDDVEGRPPQAQLRIDNTTQEIIAVLRGLVTPPALTIEVVRSITPDVVEYGWEGLEWSSSAYDKNVITGTLTMIDLTREEFPFVGFDSRWRGLFS